MAMMDGNDRPDGGGDWWSANQPQDTQPTAPNPVIANQIQLLYQENLGRSASPQEIQDWINGSGGGNYLVIRNGIMGSDEAKAYAASKKPKPNPDPNQDPGTGGGTPPGVPTSGFGAAPPPYASNPDAPVYSPMPTYTPPTWTGGDYQNPTEADLLASPGYQSRLDTLVKGQGRRFAAQGTILNGGTLTALDRTAQDYASNEYQTLRNNTFEAYKQKYQQFTDAAGMDLAARTANANENQNTFANNTASYLSGNARTLNDYLTNVSTKRNSELDYWGRLQDLNNTGANLAGGSYRP